MNYSKLNEKDFKTQFVASYMAYNADDSMSPMTAIMKAEVAWNRLRETAIIYDAQHQDSY